MFIDVSALEHHLGFLLMEVAASSQTATGAALCCVRCLLCSIWQSQWESNKQLPGSGKLELLVLLKEQQNPTVAEGDCCQLGHLLCSLVPKEGACGASPCGASVLGSGSTGNPRGNVLLAQSIAAGSRRRERVPASFWAWQGLKGRTVEMLPTSAHSAAAPHESPTANHVCVTSAEIT